MGSPVFTNVLCHRCGATGRTAAGDNCERCEGSGFTKGPGHSPVPTAKLSITELNLRDARRAEAQRRAA